MEPSYNINYSTFATWRQKRNNPQRKAPVYQPAFIEVAVHSPEIHPTGGFKIDVPGVASLRFQNLADVGITTLLTDGVDLKGAKLRP